MLPASTEAGGAVELVEPGIDDTGGPHFQQIGVVSARPSARFAACPSTGAGQYYDMAVGEVISENGVNESRTD